MRISDWSSDVCSSDLHDEEPEALLIPCDGGIWEADARAELDDAARDIDSALGDVEEDVDTLGGLAFVIAGHVPVPGDVLLHEQSGWRSEEHTSELQSLMRISYAVFCLTKTKEQYTHDERISHTCNADRHMN